MPSALNIRVSFKYDQFGRRIYKSSSSGTSIFAYDEDNLIEEANASGAVVARYSQGLNIDEPLAMLRSGTTSYYQADGLGSLTSLSNTAGALAQTYTFDSFGKQTASSGSLTNPFQFTGRESDSETNLYFLRARYYDPAIGRFLSEDPIGFKGGIDFYRYVRNNPVRFTDPSGRGPISCAKCLYYMYKCADEIVPCKQNLDKKYKTDEELCTATNSKDADEAYFKVCWLGSENCQKKLKYCGECSLWPVKIGDPHFHQ